jgi:hypothetical protein
VGDRCLFAAIGGDNRSLHVALFAMDPVTGEKTMIIRSFSGKAFPKAGGKRPDWYQEGEAPKPELVTEF